MFGEAAGARPFSELLQAGDTPPAVRIDPANDIVVLPYSSGTTGLPKGVMLTHRNLVANLCQCEGMEGFDAFGEKDVVIAVLPFFHIYGMVVIMMLGLAGGGTIVSMPRFDMAEFLGLVQKHKATVAAARAADRAGPGEAPDGGAVRPLERAPGLLRRRAARRGDGARAQAKLGCPVVQGYGMTEASPVTHLSPDAERAAPAGIGRPHRARTRR